MNKNDFQMILIAAFCIVIILFLFIGRNCSGAEPHGRSLRRLTENEAILHLVTPRAQYRPRLPYSSKKIEAYKDTVYRTKLVEAFRSAAKAFDVPTNLLIAMSYRETVFRPKLVGPGGERGILQVMPYVAKRKACKAHCGDLQSPEGGALCGACWLAKGRDHCGGLVGGINSYVSGRCNPTSVSAQRATQNRLWVWKYLNELTGTIEEVPKAKFAKIGERK